MSANLADKRARQKQLNANTKAAVCGVAAIRRPPRSASYLNTRTVTVKTVPAKIAKISRQTTQPFSANTEHSIPRTTKLPQALMHAVEIELTSFHSAAQTAISAAEQARQIQAAKAAAESRKQHQAAVKQAEKNLHKKKSELLRTAIQKMAEMPEAGMQAC